MRGRWNKNETTFLKRNYKKLTQREIGERLGRSGRTIGAKCSRLGLKKKEPKRLAILEMLKEGPVFHTELTTVFNYKNRSALTLLMKRIKRDFDVKMVRLNTLPKDNIFFFNTSDNKIKAFEMVKEKHPQYIFRRDGKAVRWDRARPILDNCLVLTGHGHKVKRFDTEKYAVRNSLINRIRFIKDRIKVNTEKLVKISKRKYKDKILKQNKIDEINSRVLKLRSIIVEVSKRIDKLKD